MHAVIQINAYNEAAGTNRHNERSSADDKGVPGRPRILAGEKHGGAARAVRNGGIPPRRAMHVEAFFSDATIFRDYTDERHTYTMLHLTDATFSFKDAKFRGTLC